MKLSDYVAKFLSERGVKHVFAISGGASVHLIHSIAEASGIEFVCPQHEQAGAMAADGYSRVSGSLGAAIATSGPGATNLITGVCGAYFDSVPVIFITGQVSTFRMKGDIGVRQIGFQETDCMDMYKSITNYAVTLDKAKNIRHELEKGYFLAKHGRPGPVLIDIPDNLQREEVNPIKLKPFIPEDNPMQYKPKDGDLERCMELFKESKRPVVVLGWGIHLANAHKKTRKFVERLGFPVVPTWAIAHIIPTDHPLFVGTFGTHGTRYANFAVQNSDLILSIGSRLDTKATGSPINTFAREAKKIVVDIDANELNKFKKFGMDVELLINSDAKDFVISMYTKIQDMKKVDVYNWLKQIKVWKQKYPICPHKYYQEEDVNPYVFVKALSRESAEGDTIVIDTGCTVAWIMQAFDFKENQRLFHDFNNTAMGWALPASIGACFALDKKPITCVTGDGALLMNIQELATVTKHQLPIKIFLLNNEGYSMVQQTQDQWLESKYYATSLEGGLTSPNFSRIAEAHGIRSITISKNYEIDETIKKVMNHNGPVFCNVMIKPEHRVIPQVKFGKPNEDPEPLLPREEFFGNMIIKPIDESTISKFISPKDSDPYSGT